MILSSRNENENISIKEFSKKGQDNNRDLSFDKVDCISNAVHFKFVYCLSIHFTIGFLILTPQNFIRASSTWAGLKPGSRWPVLLDSSSRITYMFPLTSSFIKTKQLQTLCTFCSECIEQIKLRHGEL